MSERPRALPAWMAKRAEKVKEKEPLKSRRKPKTARAALYLMNEKELVEAAVSFLTEAAAVAPLPDQKIEVKAGEQTLSASKTTAKPVTEASDDDSTDCGDAQESTYVSETDLDITEVETLPYTKSPQHQGPEGQRSGPGQDHGGVMNVGQEAEKKEEHTQLPADTAEKEDDDALRLVREIFFT